MLGWLNVFKFAWLNVFKFAVSFGSIEQDPGSSSEPCVTKWPDASSKEARVSDHFSSRVKWPGMCLLFSGQTWPDMR